VETGAFLFFSKTITVHEHCNYMFHQLPAKPNWFFLCFRSMNGNALDKVEAYMDIERMQREIREEKEKQNVLKETELFVLDNSLRESTAGQLRGHTIENKWKIYEQVRGSRWDN